MKKPGVSARLQFLLSCDFIVFLVLPPDFLPFVSEDAKNDFVLVGSVFEDLLAFRSFYLEAAVLVAAQASGIRAINRRADFP